MKKLIPALAMLLVAAVLMGTSTYAWFSMNTTVSATGMSVTATTPINILINDAASGAWGSSATADEAYTGKLYPASTDDTTNFNAIKNAGNYIGTAGAGGIAEDDTKFQATMTRAAATMETGNASATGYCAVYTFSLKVSEVQTATVPVYLSKLTVSASAGALNTTVRVALLDGSTLKGIYAINGADTSYNAVKAAAALTDGDTIFYDHDSDSGTADVINPAKITAMSSSNVDYAASGTGVITYRAANQIDLPADGSAKTITVVVWFEGQDSHCVNVNAGATCDVAFDFSQYVAP